ncbi:MAG: 16S rRNA (cytosine(1402)-N(4))-methyltransferase RsmH [Pseudomonadota bacterium]
MTGRGTSDHGKDVSAGGPARHIPVMLNEVLLALQPGRGSAIVDGTFGAGGYTSAILETGANVLAIDRDPAAIAEGQALVGQYPDQLKLVSGRFSEMEPIARENGVASVDGVVLDIGVSSMQLDQAERGFSFMKDGPLDMRMEQDGPSAADVVNHVKQSDLTRIIGILGEERQASRISGAIAKRRQNEPFSRTLDLAAVVEAVLGRKAGDRIHPATRTFQALRIFVNRELEELARALHGAERLLAAGGRLVVVTFHSLEDRIVKRFFADRSKQASVSRHLPQAAEKAQTFKIEKRGVMTATDTEIEQNPRSRSAKLRYGIRTESPALDEDLSIFGLPNLVELDDLDVRGALS